MIRKTLTLIIVSFLLPFLSFSADTKTYKIGCNKNYYPYITTNKETGELDGIIIDWWELWAQKTGVEIEFVPADLASIIEKTKKNEVDAIAGLFYSDKRAEILDYGDGLLRMKTVLFLKKGYKPEIIHSISDSIGVLKSDLAYSYFQEEYPELKLKICNRFIDLQNLVTNKSIAGFVYDVPNPAIGNYKGIKAPKGYYEYEILYEQDLRVAVKTGNIEMLKLITAGASKMLDAELIEIADQWYFLEPDRTLLLILLGAAVIVGALFSLIIFYLFRSKRKIREMEDFVSKTDWKLIIDKGENDQIEFKSSVRWDYRQKKANKALEKVIAKTISAFLNTQGGMLFIGVDDDGNILGLEKDYNCLSKKSRDGFLLNLTNIINNYLGKSLHKFIQINIISINEKEVCIVSVEESDKPVFIGKADNEEFFIRASASSQPLGVRETHNYINSRWK